MINLYRVPVDVYHLPTMHYGYRARIGYTSPPATTEVFPYEFYRMAPAGVTLVLTTLAIRQMNKAEIDSSYQIALDAVDAMKEARVDVMVLGGMPINAAKGLNQVDSLAAEVHARLGVPVVTSIEAQIDALRKLGARKVAVAHPFGPEQEAFFSECTAKFGFELMACEGMQRRAIDLGLIRLEETAELVRRIKNAHPQADTLWLPCPHWACLDVIDELESALNINVVGACQAIVWKALRTAGVEDHVPNAGRLFRDG